MKIRGPTFSAEYTHLYSPHGTECGVRHVLGTQNALVIALFTEIKQTMSLFIKERQVTFESPKLTFKELLFLAWKKQNNIKGYLMG